MNSLKRCFVIGFFSASMLFATGSLAAPAGMSQGCQEHYAKYAASGAPKAFAKGKTKACGWKGPGGSVSLAEAKKRAVAFCVANGGDGCAVVESVK